MKRLIGIALILAASGCSSTSTPDMAAAVQVSFATQAAPALAAARSGLTSDTVVTGSDTLVLTSVEVVLRQIELKNAQSADCATVAGDDGCEEFEIGPVLVNLPLTPGAQQEFALDSIPNGTYDRIDFEVHKPDNGDPQDQAFITANPDFASTSIRVRGTFNGQAFEFTTELDIEQELALSPVLTVTDGSSINVTIFVDVGTWFLVNGAVVEPTAGNQSAIEQSIKDSFKAFEDDDRSGSRDN
jgi:hypothetical protein